MEEGLQCGTVEDAPQEPETHDQSMQADRGDHAAGKRRRNDAAAPIHADSHDERQRHAEVDEVAQNLNADEALGFVPRLEYRKVELLDHQAQRDSNQ